MIIFFLFTFRLLPMKMYKKKRSKELQNILRIKGITGGNGMETRGNAGGPKLTWSSFQRLWQDICRRYEHFSKSLFTCEYCLKIDLKNSCKTAFWAGANTERDTFCAAWWKRYTQMQRTRSLQGLSHMLTLTLATTTKRQKCSKLPTWINAEGPMWRADASQTTHLKHTHSTHSGLGWPFFKKNSFGLFAYKLILKYGTLKGKQADTNMCGERSKAFKMKSAQY